MKLVGHKTGAATLKRSKDNGRDSKFQLNLSK